MNLGIAAVGCDLHRLWAAHSADLPLGCHRQAEVQLVIWRQRVCGVDVLGGIAGGLVAWGDGGGE